MAKNTSLLKIEGTLGELTFYKSQDGFLVKTKSGVSKQRIDNDPAFSRTRENGKEFGEIARSGKVLRTAIRPLLLEAKDTKVTSRLVKVMGAVKNSDATSQRGERTVFNGLATDLGKSYLKGFDFNNKAVLGSILYSAMEVDSSTGVITLNQLRPKLEIAAPSGSTHVTLLSASANVDFLTEDFSLSLSNTETIAVHDVNPVDVVLTPQAVPSGSGTSMLFFLMSFSQEVNGSLYDLRNGAYNVLNLIEVL
ncbi:hypothetical protein AAU57_12860 [Nonlabens sp. YIK11]|uniref:hypothetical protein n=1 Tax=Nonlabens sp. YIK11 TaxID=1453349 RepID=UPI0006DBD849|nr:hypothetical protein [Nonlabens sp. YIK11]KQC34124.1 hypothetical protein AAU57_12860 [Nonlabens sp. YIK11]